MTIRDCQTAEEVRAAIKAARTWRRKMFEQRPEPMPMAPPVKPSTSTDEISNEQLQIWLDKQGVIKPSVPEPDPRYVSDRIRIILDVVCATVGVEPEDVRGKRQFYKLVRARQLTWYLLRKHSTLSFKNIAARFNVDHTSIVNGVQRIEQSMISSPRARHDVEYLMNVLNEKFQINVGK